jgi:hypothetical protein
MTERITVCENARLQHENFDILKNLTIKLSKLHIVSSVLLLTQPYADDLMKLYACNIYLFLYY